MKKSLLLALLLAACGGPSSSGTNTDGSHPGGDAGGNPGGDGGSAVTGGQPSALDVLSPKYSSVSIEVDYATNAAPYVGAGGLTQSDLWQITEDNLARIFQKSAKTLTVPHTLDKMEALTDVASGTYTTQKILDIAAAHRGTAPSAGTSASFYVVFLDGYLEDAGAPQMNVIGVSIGDTGVVAMFKPVIASTGTGIGGSAMNVEQSTLVHELGHALGLVNNGVPLASQHQDTAHGAHCTNTKCTMYWENEGKASAVAFAQQAFGQGSDILYGAECLADIDAVAH